MWHTLRIYFNLVSSTDEVKVHFSQGIFKIIVITLYYIRFSIFVVRKLGFQSLWFISKHRYCTKATERSPMDDGDEGARCFPLSGSCWIPLLYPRDNAVSIATSYGLEIRGVGVRVPVRSRIFSSPFSSRSVLGFTQLPSQWVPVALPSGVKRQGREADHSPPTSAEVKRTWIYIFTTPYVFMA
jgi:hypothetical protein